MHCRWLLEFPLWCGGVEVCSIPAAKGGIRNINSGAFEIDLNDLEIQGAE